MKPLRDLLYKAGIEEVNGPTSISIDKVTFDSRKVTPGNLFVAVKGTAYDGHAYISDVIKKGAIAIVCEELPKELDEKVTYIKVKNSASALAFIAANYFGNPS